MSRFNEISAAALLRLIGTPQCPTILDVTLDDDLALLPGRVPTSRPVPYLNIEDLAGTLDGKAVVVVCHKGLKLSHGSAALLRSAGIKADVLEGGAVAWNAASHPAVNYAALNGNASGALWVTRQRPKIDRIACPWLIRRFVDPDARFIFVPANEVLAVADRFQAVPFDVPEAHWSHRAEFCTFETILSGLGLEYEPLTHMARIVRAADTGQCDKVPEAAGLLAFSVGLSRMHGDDTRQLEAGMAFYDALFRWARDGRDEVHDWPGQHQ